MADSDWFSEEVVTEMAQRVGLRIPPERAAGVASRLATIQQAVARWRPEVGGVEPFREFEFAAATTHSAVVADASDTPGQTFGKVDGTPDLLQVSEAIRDRKLSIVTLTESLLAGIDDLNPRLNAYLTVSRDRAIEDAIRLEGELDRGRYRGRLHGVPIAHKDLIDTNGIRTTYHTDHFKDHMPTADAPVVERLAEAGTVLLGKANTLELGSGDGPVFGLALNPWDRDRQVGGSSSGSAVAVAAGLALAATGTDAGGSIRIPAAFCGIVGLKPTAGLVFMGDGRNGISVAGPMTRTVTDAALMLEGMAAVGPLAERLQVNLKEFRVGVPVDWLDTPTEEDVKDGFQVALDALRRAGAHVREVRLPYAEPSETLGALITHVDCFGKYRFLLESEAKLSPFFHELLLATELYGASDYLTAQRLRRLLVSDVEAVHSEVDLIITPTVPFRAARLDDMQLTVDGLVVDARTGQGRFTRLSNLTGQPSVSVPVGIDSNGMPLSVQVIGRPYEERAVLSAARVIELANPRSIARPSVHL